MRNENPILAKNFRLFFKLYSELIYPKKKYITSNKKVVLEPVLNVNKKMINIKVLQTAFLVFEAIARPIATTSDRIFAIVIKALFIGLGIYSSRNHNPEPYVAM
jgi:hypothetical protein